VFTAGGKLLGFNNNRSLQRRMAMLRSALKKWDALTPAEKTAKVDDLTEVDKKYTRAFPKDGNVLKVYTRCLERKNGNLKAMAKQGVGTAAGVDHVWFTKEEVDQIRTLVTKGGGMLPKRLSLRLARFNGVDNTRGEPPRWKVSEVEKSHFSIDAKGNIKWELSMQTADRKRGFSGKGAGKIAFDPKGRLRIFEMTVIGNHWGEGIHTAGARPGQQPLGIVFQLTPAKKPQDRIPPQAMHWEKGYWQAERE